MEIPDIQIKGGDIDIIQIPFTPDYLLEPPQALQVPVPVTTQIGVCLLYTSPSPRDRTRSRMPSSA